MNVGSLETLGTLFTLLPGLLTYLIIRYLTNREKEIEATEAILLGLGYTLIVNALASALDSTESSINYTNLFGLTIVAIVLGLIIAISVNNGLIYGVLRACRLTSESVWATTWTTAFREYNDQGGEHVLLYLKDESKIMGAVKGWSTSDQNGHVALLDSYWLDEDNEKISVPGLMLIPRADISAIQFMTFST